MSIIGVIPARGGSKGLPGKNVKPIAGRPMIQWIIEAALAAKTLDRVFVSTDGDDIAAAAREAGAEVIRRPDEISGDTAAIEDSLRHVVRTLEAQGERIEIMVLMQANVPIRKPGFIDEVVRALQDSDFTSVVSACEVKQRPEWMKKEQDGVLVPFMECACYRRQELPDLYVIDGAVEAIRRDVLMDTEGKSGVHVYFGDRMGFRVQEALYSMDVDSIDDFNIIDPVLAAVNRAKP
jgi:CMP-N-acetylneuraminic acid synthetase